MKELSLIILAYNDRDSLEKLLPKAHSILKSFFDKFEIIVVDDCSLDQTEELVIQLQQKLNSIIYYKNRTNKGVGYTFEKGVSIAQFKVIAYTDGDGQYEINDIISLYPYLSNCEIVSGYRKNRAEGMNRWIISKTYNLMLNLIFELRLKDTNSALKLYQTEILKKTLPLKAHNGFYDAEVLIKAKKKGYEIREIEINHYSRQFGKANGVKLKSLYNVFRSMISFRNDSRI